jgi:hypothetical protein
MHEKILVPGIGSIIRDRRQVPPSRMQPASASSSMSPDASMSMETEASRRRKALPQKNA